VPRQQLLLLSKELILIRSLNIAHRGASSLAPENTFAAFDKAIETGADGIEFDVQLSKDNVPVIIHDQILERTTTGRGRVKDFTLAELKKYDAGSWFEPQFKDQNIPALEDLLNRYKESGLLFNIELKNEATGYPGIEESVLQCISNFKLEDRVIISSFNHESLALCRKLNPNVRTGMLYLKNIKTPWHIARSLGCYSVHPLFYYLKFDEIMAGFKEHNLPLYPWTVNYPKQMKAFAAAGIEGIITDYPQKLKKILNTT